MDKVMPLETKLLTKKIGSFHAISGVIQSCQDRWALNRCLNAWNTGPLHKD